MQPDMSLMFVLGAALCTGWAFVLRWILWRQLRQIKGGLPPAATIAPAAAGGSPRSDLVPATSPLRPAELAYLWRDGDMTHTMLVLVVDLVQRTVKSHGDQDLIGLQPYETAIITNVKDFVGRWAHGKIGEIVAVRDIANPIQWLVRVRAIKAFFGDTLRGFVKDFTKDPLHIRKYFSWSGIVRFTIELCTSSAKHGVEHSLHDLLLANGMLVPPARCRRYAWVALLPAPAMVAAAVTLDYQFLPKGQWLAFAVVFAFGVFNAAGIRALLALPALVPSYEEFRRIAAELPRSGKRMLLVKTVLRFSRLLIGWLTLVLCLLLAAVEFGIETLLLRLLPVEALPLLATSTILALPIIQAVLDWHSLTTRDHASTMAVKLIAEAHRRIAATSPLERLKEMLTDPNYEPQFSETLAIYGIETLWLLG